MTTVISHCKRSNQCFQREQGECKLFTRESED